MIRHGLDDGIVGNALVLRENQYRQVEGGSGGDKAVEQNLERVQERRVQHEGEGAPANVGDPGGADIDKTGF